MELLVRIMVILVISMVIIKMIAVIPVCIQRLDCRLQAGFTHGGPNSFTACGGSRIHPPYPILRRTARCMIWNGLFTKALTRPCGQNSDYLTSARGALLDASWDT